MVSSTAEAKTGGAFEWVQSLTDPIDVAARYQMGLIGLTAVADIIDARGVYLHRFPMQNIMIGQKDVKFVCSGDITQDWIVGEYVRMDILFSNGTSNGLVLTQTVNILVLLGITKPPIIDPLTGSMGASFSNQDFNTGATT